MLQSIASTLLPSLTKNSRLKLKRSNKKLTICLEVSSIAVDLLLRVRQVQTVTLVEEMPIEKRKIRSANRKF